MHIIPLGNTYSEEVKNKGMEKIFQWNYTKSGGWKYDLQIQTHVNKHQRGTTGYCRTKHSKNLSEGDQIKKDL